MQVASAFLAGVAGSVAMAITIATARHFGVSQLDMPMYLGSLVTGAVNSATWWLGLALHVAGSGVLGLVYAAGFEYVAHRSGWRIGLVFGFVNFIIGGFVLGLMSGVHPMMVPPGAGPGPNRLIAPGVFATNFSATSTVGFLVGHLMYGAVVGAIYRTSPAVGPGRRLDGGRATHQL